VPVGHFTFTAESGFPVTATLGDDGVWACEAGPLADYLNAFYGPNDGNAHDGPFGTESLAAAAGEFGAAPALHDVHPPDPDTVY
jgi:hypothetical protein